MILRLPLLLVARELLQGRNLGLLLLTSLPADILRAVEDVAAVAAEEDNGASDPVLHRGIRSIGVGLDMALLSGVVAYGWCRVESKQKFPSARPPRHPLAGLRRNGIESSNPKINFKKKCESPCMKI